MAVIRKNELKALPSQEMEKKLEEVETEIVRESGLRNNTGRPNNPGKYRELKKVRARIYTLMSLKAKAGTVVAAKPSTANTVTNSKEVSKSF